VADLIKIDIPKGKLTASIRILSLEPPSREDILKALTDSKVVYGILDDVVDICSLKKTNEAMIVARGDPPIPGKDGWVEIFWDKTKEQSKDFDDEKIIDFRETSKIISVNEGTLLAQRHPPQEGLPGRAVTGQEIMPPKPKEARLTAGRGVKLDDEGDMAYSAIQGRPVLKKSGGIIHIVSVEPSYTVSGDVNIKTGNIRFKGDVTVTGNITETMTVEASGSVKVGGIITGANVFCGENLVVQKNIISSSITAGIGNVECGKIKYLMQDLYTDLTGLVQLLEQLKGKLANLDKIPFSQVVNSIIENRFKNIRIYAKQLVNTATFNLPFEVAEAVDSVKKIIGVQFTVDDFKDMMQNLARALEIMGYQETQGSKVVANSTFASSIKCSGEVIITGKGCVNTTIFAGGNVKITGPFKGGEIYSEGNVEIDELGSNLGAPPLVRVKKNNHVKIGKTLAGSVIQVGSSRIHITKELSEARYKLNSEGNAVEIS
jgi:uncharacterized protein (DUF342 family)